MVRIPVGDLLPADSPRRSGEDMHHVRTLAEVAADLPPILVQKSTMRVIDGMHRLRAAMRANADTVRARMVNCSDGQAFMLAVRSNIGHGLPLTLADRKAAAHRVLLAEPRWSDRSVAALTGLSHKTVGAIRRRSTGEFPQSTERLGRDGRLRSVVPRPVPAPAPPAPVTPTAPVTPMAPVTPPAPVRLPSSPESARHHQHTQLRALMQDPSLRLSENGRALLRLLSTRAVSPGDWKNLLRELPPHCVEAVAGLTAHYAAVWQELTEELKVARVVVN
ncbi:ParB/RepB/Spo0J family partition protein [Saccharothrix syringae]|uniref:ParB/RepB/Spo0J family partition protein n=1 Tax=Saccharothrix syringae TaxID=103733 RepID=UPI000690FE29|nr:ParB N-terminal domain-containing protein [Saccharothrix syringae]